MPFSAGVQSTHRPLEQLVIKNADGLAFAGSDARAPVSGSCRTSLCPATTRYSRYVRAKRDELTRHPYVPGVSFALQQRCRAVCTFALGLRCGTSARVPMRPSSSRMSFSAKRRAIEASSKTLIRFTPSSGILMLGLVRIALRRPYTFVVLAIFILIIGPLSAMRTPTDIFPDIRIPVISVVWQYTGLPPDQMVGRITSPFERTLTTTVNDVEHIEAESVAGFGIIKIFFHPGVNLTTPNAHAPSVPPTQLR